MSLRIEEFAAVLERKKGLQESPDSALNVEYLKNCIFRFMATTEHSEKKRLFPVISTILGLTSEEKSTIKVTLDEIEVEKNGGITFTSSIENWFSFGSGN